MGEAFVPGLIAVGAIVGVIASLVVKVNKKIDANYALAGKLAQKS